MHAIQNVILPTVYPEKYMYAFASVVTQLMINKNDNIVAKNRFEANRNHKLLSP